MKIAVHRCDITPEHPVMQGGYKRDHPFEGIHDRIGASIMVLEVDGAVRVWVSCDVSNGTAQLVDGVLEQLDELGSPLRRDQLVLAGTHTHSAPNINVHWDELADRDYFMHLCKVLGEEISKALQMKRVEVHGFRYSDVLIDGLYSNRNDINKLSDKHCHLIAFDGEDGMIALYCCMSHHCTVLGPKNYLISADLFGALRERLEREFGAFVLMAQGNAGDMGNHMYRQSSTFEELDRQADAIMSQILNKIDWHGIDLDGYRYRRFALEERYTVDCAFYQQRKSDYLHQLETSHDAEEVKWLNSAIRGCDRKLEGGSSERAVSMPVEIIDMHDAKMVVVPGELGSILGLRIKACSDRQPCIIWGYANGSNLGYLVEREAYDADSFESRTSPYPAGVADDYEQFIESVLNEK